MKRALISIVLISVAFSADARDEHIRPYSEGVAAAEMEDWGTVARKMQEAIQYESQESKSVRTRRGFIPYVPHFWLGIAWANQQKWEAALGELETSEKQGVIQNTTFYARLRSTRSRIESRQASTTSSAGLEEARSVADTALKQALAAQASATTAGAARLTEFRQANQKLEDALATRREGTVEGYRKTAGMATQAAALFREAAEKAMAQPGGVKVQRRPAPVRVPVEPDPGANDEPVSVTESSVGEIEPAPPATIALPESEPAETIEIEPPASSEEEPIETGTSEPPPVRTATALPPTPQATSPASEPERGSSDTRSALVEAYRLIASGELQNSSSMLSSLIIANPEMVEALVLRGYARYLQGVLEREERMLRAAEEDFRSALAINPRIRLDDRSFSPKAIRFFDDVKRSMN